MFQGLTIFRHKSKETYSEGVFVGKIVGVYFSAHWCPPSRDFTPILRNFYFQVEDDVEILFVSSDQTKEEMIIYLEGYHGDWFHLPYSSQLGQYLSIQWEINSIPTLAIFKPNGTPIVRNARSLVENCQNPQQLINQWKSL